MSEPAKAVVHLELNPETGAFRCELPNNFIVALGGIRDALDILTKSLPVVRAEAEDSVIVHAESGKIEIVEKGKGKRATIYKFGK